MAASTASKNRKEKRENRNKTIAQEVKQSVAKELGLKTTVPGPFGYLQGEKTTLAYNLKGKDKKFYGQEASAATNEALVKRGILKRGSQNPDGSWNYQQVSGSGYSASDIKSIKYGQSGGGAMGSGDPTGAMSSTPISKEMLQRQNKIKGLTTAALSFAVPSIGGTALRLSATKSLADAAQAQPEYNEYMGKFEAKQTGKKFTSTRNVLGLLNSQHNKKTLTDTLG
tara:strand:- start:1229 stop:1906 length:678 start_codon:yes stop_codon:yes gene_type:complete